MTTFVFVMQHKPTPEQMVAARGISDRVVCLAGNPADRIEGVEYLGSTSLLNVPDDPSLPRDWFVQRAQEIFGILGNPAEGDIVHIMGQQQLAQSMSALARDGGMNRVESVTPRKSVDQAQPDGSVRKVSVFEFAGFRQIYDF